METVIQESKSCRANKSALVSPPLVPSCVATDIFYASMTLGHVYDLDLKKNESLIKETIIQAQGEVKVLPTPSLRCSYTSSDGTGGVYQTSQGDLDQLYPRPRQLSEQMPSH